MKINICCVCVRECVSCVCVRAIPLIKKLMMMATQYLWGKIERNRLFHLKGNMRMAVTFCHIYGVSKVVAYDAGYLLPIV